MAFFKRMRNKVLRVFKAGYVVVPKLKILIAMLQVQGGLVSTFQINLPDTFLKILQDFNFCNDAGRIRDQPC